MPELTMANKPTVPTVDPDLQEAYARRHLALGLGAGVSKMSNVPDWKELLCRVADRLPRARRKIVLRLLEEQHEATVVAAYLRSRAGTDGNFAKALRDSLYKNFSFNEPVTKSNHRRFASHIRETNTTLHAVGTMCGVSVGHDKYAPNSRIRAVMTFNVDDLLETYTRARFKSRVLRTVERASASASGSRIHSYHVHGFLVRDIPSRRRSQPRTVESDDRLVFTEQQYFDLFGNSNGFVNYTMLFLLREYKFLFVGLSLSDPNLRRVLHLSFTERVRELRAEGESERKSRKAATRHWAIMQRKDPESDRVTKELLAGLGVKPVWVRRWSDIPSIFRALYKATGDSWDSVI